MLLKLAGQKKYSPRKNCIYEWTSWGYGFRYEEPKEDITWFKTMRWKSLARFLDNHPNGSELEGEIKNITEFGIFVAASDQVDGLIHLSDVSWEGNAEEIISNYKKGMLLKLKF